MKILILDIETSPHTGFHWGLFQQNISIGQLIESSTVLCWAAKWLGEKKVHFSSVYETTPIKMIKEIHKLIDEADAIITYNGKRFDMPTLNKEFLIHKLPPPSPYKDIDLINTARGKFKFASNKLDYIAQVLGVGQKTSHQGMPLWIECMAMNPKAWKLMKKYNCNDVILTEQVYEKLKGWIQIHPNHNVYSDGIVCMNCGSKKLHKRGTSRTLAKTYVRVQCQSCGKWGKVNETKKYSSVINI